MNHKTINRSIACGIFAVSFFVYIKTLAATVIFGDVGELCAAGFALQVPHPPGSPLLLLLLRLSAMIPVLHDVAARMHLVSALAGAAACSVLYLVIIRILRQWWSSPASILHSYVFYGSGIVGSLSLAFSKTFWESATAINVNGVSMLFAAVILLLGFFRYDARDREHGDRYLLLIAYLIGLSIGIHLLSLLMIFPITFLWYLGTHELSAKSFARVTIISLAVFAVIYYGIVKIFPMLLSANFFGFKHSLLVIVPILILIAALYGMYFFSKHKKNGYLTVLAAFVLLVLGYSTNFSILVRSQAHPPMNEYAPGTLTSWAAYVDRGQYSNTPVVNRQWDNDPEKQSYYKKYASNADYFLRYQIMHMYVRYLAWNFIGCDGDFTGAGVQWMQFSLIPFLLGIVGAYWLWRKKPLIAYSLLIMFVLMGPAIAWRANQQEPQANEYDYYYLGSFFIYALWIGIGTFAVFDFAKSALHTPRALQRFGLGFTTCMFVFVPINMLINNYRHENRSGNSAAWDYAYNLLQTCENNAVLFTNGDNDTFPLWYVQDVEGIRRDVRIVNLSLLNTSWYILQLKHDSSYEAGPLDISTPDAEIENIQPVQFEPCMVEIPIDSVIDQQYRTKNAETVTLDTAYGKHKVMRFYMPSTLQTGPLKGLRPQDVMVLDIVKTSGLRRPLYFAMTVPENATIGLSGQLKKNGLASRLVPFQCRPLVDDIDVPAVEANIFSTVREPQKTHQPGYLWQCFRDSTVHLDEGVREIAATNYRTIFFTYALYLLNIRHQPEKAGSVLDHMEDVIPRHLVGMNYKIKYDLATLYFMAGKNGQYTELLEELIRDLKNIPPYAIQEHLSQYNPYIVLFTCYTATHQFDNAEKIIPIIRLYYGMQQGTEQVVMEMQRHLAFERSKITAEHMNTQPEQK